jgi:hypothetical protein
MKAGMAKEKKGSIVERAGKLYVRLSYTDQLGKRRELMRRAQDRKHARELQKQLVKQLDSAEQGNQRAELDAQKMTFAKAAAAYDAAKLVPAVYVGDRKVAGLRGVRTPKANLKRLRRPDDIRRSPNSRCFAGICRTSRRHFRNGLAL